MLTVWAPDSSPDPRSQHPFAGPLVTPCSHFREPKSGRDSEGTTSPSNWVSEEAGADLQDARRGPRPTPPVIRGQEGAVKVPTSRPATRESPRVGSAGKPAWTVKVGGP